ncbi:vitronectin isoform X2 [Sorex fumeus]|uniref:vitronectin isoform X2 n=1 Tax=Sorex fumeus TaxID=62283 RepID=UPI0024AD79DB|nr:vitronectin isoform X2 [Sorex fumeus]
MVPARPLLMLALLAGVVLADQETCKGRCMEGFNKDRKCQCDELCSYYQSCCTDYLAECKPLVTRGDVFTRPEDEYHYYDYETRDNASSTHTQPESANPKPERPSQTPEQTMPILNHEVKPEVAIQGPEVSGQRLDTMHQGTEEELCSGKPFDAFTDLKNGSLFAFRGPYCYELDEKAVRPGYPKLIRDVWGIEGPIDAAFTRINCQGKTYLFKGSQYWRFEDGVLDPDYPRDISEGFHGIPDNVDAALALPAHSYTGRERVYFFKARLRPTLLMADVHCQGNSTGCTSSTNSPARRSVKAAPSRPYSRTLPRSGGAWMPSSTFSSLAIPPVVLENHSSSARAGGVCPRRWMRPWLAASTSRAPLPAPPGPRSPSGGSVATGDATAHSAAAARKPTGGPAPSWVSPFCPGSPVRRATWEPTTTTTGTMIWTGW